MTAAPAAGSGTPVGITFVVIAYNEEHNIARCVEAILGQHGAEAIEVLVIDDGSSDDTARIVGRLAAADQRVRLVSQANSGRGAARAAGVARSSGRLVAMVDADIVLPPYWLATCVAELDGCHAVGGVAVPDGDAAYVWRRFSLRAKPTAPTMAVTGNNGLYHREVFERIDFNAALREGEDTDLNIRMGAAGMRTRLLPHLRVDHLEDKSFATSVRWLFECGSGATRHLLWYRKVRVPDVAFAGFLLLVVAAVVPGRGRRLGRTALAGYVPAASAAHLAGRFELALDRAGGASSAGAIAVNSVLMASYFVGRSYGLVRWWGTRDRSP